MEILLILLLILAYGLAILPFFIITSLIFLLAVLVQAAKEIIKSMMGH